MLNTFSDNSVPSCFIIFWYTERFTRMEKGTGCTDHPVGMETVQKKKVVKTEHEETKNSSRVES